MNFRLLKRDDKDGLINLLQQLSQKKIDSKQYCIHHLISNHHCRCLIVEQDGRIIGFGALVLYLTPLNGKVARIEDVIVDVEYRGQGVGREIMQTLIKWAAINDVNKIVLSSNPKREAARSLYRSLGFTKIDTEVFIREMLLEERKGLISED